MAARPVPSDAPARRPSSRRPRSDGWTDARRATFLDALKACACFNEAARRAGISRMSVWRLRRRDAEFDAACTQQLRTGVALLRDIATDRALNGLDYPVFDSAGVRIGTRKELDNRLLMFLLDRYDFSSERAEGLEARLADLVDEDDADKVTSGGNHRVAVHCVPSRPKDSLSRQARAVRRRLYELGAETAMDEIDARAESGDVAPLFAAPEQGRPRFADQRSVVHLYGEGVYGECEGAGVGVGDGTEQVDNKVTSAGNSEAKQSLANRAPAHCVPIRCAPAQAGVQSGAAHSYAIETVPSEVMQGHTAASVTSNTGPPPSRGHKIRGHGEGERGRSRKMRINRLPLPIPQYPDCGGKSALLRALYDPDPAP